MKRARSLRSCLQKTVVPLRSCQQRLRARGADAVAAQLQRAERASAASALRTPDTPSDVSHAQLPHTSTSGVASIVVDCSETCPPRCAS